MSVTDRRRGHGRHGEIGGKDLPYAEDEPVFLAPAVPLGASAGARESVRHGVYTEDITRRMSAAAFARTDWLATLRAVLTHLRQKLTAAVRRRLRWLFPAEKAEKVVDTKGPTPPAVVLGEDYAVWVRRRIKKSARPVPTHGFRQEPVVHACDRALQHMRRRRAAVLAVSALVLWQAAVATLTVGWAVVALLAGLWGIHLAERCLAQLRMNALLAGELRSQAETEQSRALPYFYERRRSGDRHRFIGAGLQAWQEAVIGIDVEPAPESQDDEDDNTGPAPSTSSTTRNPGHPDMVQMANAVLEALAKHSKPVDRKPLKHFTAAQLHDYIARRLNDPAPSHHPDHPKLRVEVTGIAGIHHKRWDQIDDDGWRSLHALAVDSTGDKPAEEIARRYIWARVTAWNGELIAAILVNFAYRGGFLRVTVRPHIMGPLNPRVADLGSADLLTPRWLGRAAFNALVDIFAGLGRLVRRKARPCPELDPGSGPVSLREVYSIRRLEDMHMYDDARYYVQMMQRRVFDSTEVFLRDHNVDIAAYRQQSTAIYNFGVMNGGTMTGAVQATPFSVDSSMTN
ncbi:hypothetical protein [Streptomyces sp. Ru73]|uniref:hypothetical protein n=1 Tax=Streptomyces sp. Ru73 TaxID=2080748 RepID=UPI0021562D79|nr:hypothetical protein [Streptomyces sp. Ru73]